MPWCGADDFVGLEAKALLPESPFQLIAVEGGGRGWEIHGFNIESGVPHMAGQELVKYSGHAVHFVTVSADRRFNDPRSGDSTT